MKKTEKNLTLQEVADSIDQSVEAKHSTFADSAESTGAFAQIEDSDEGIPIAHRRRQRRRLAHFAAVGRRPAPAAVLHCLRLRHRLGFLGPRQIRVAHRQEYPITNIQRPKK